MKDNADAMTVFVIRRLLRGVVALQVLSLRVFAIGNPLDMLRGGMSHSVGGRQ